MRNLLLLIIAIIILLPSCSNNDLGSAKKASIIPKPVELIELEYNYKISDNLTIYLSEEDKGLAIVANYLKERIEFSVADVEVNILLDKNDDQGIHLILTDDDELGKEGYLLNTDGNISIQGNSAAGIFYGVQTLFQLLPTEIYGSQPRDFDLILPAVKIKDNPRYSYRGMHLDPCRHFFSVETTKRYLDYMAYHKLNKFHWHLTEDQGWRIEIKKYPKLIEIGSKRKGTLILSHEVKWDEQKYDTIPVEGYYTQDDIREVVQYAKELFIEVIPEIEMPGHSTAALAAYPHLSCTGGPFEVLQRPGVIDDVYCAGNDSVFVFMKDIIDEIVELFPSEYIHIGGDECPKSKWEECQKCQKRMKDEGLANEHELQSWFISEIEKYINSKGKTLIGWSEIMEGGIAPNAVLQSWQGVKAGIEAAKQGHKAIMSPYQYLYFDGIYVDRKYAEMEPFGQKYCSTNTENAYSFEPTPDTIPNEFHKFFIGAEATMWTEFIKTESHLEYMLMPRISALSEICWTQKDLKDYANFKSRMNNQYLRYDEMGINYRIPHPEVADTIYLKAGELVTIDNPTGVTEIRYTLDETEPTINSLLFSKGFNIKENTMLKSRCYNKKGRGSSVFISVIIVE